MATRTVRIEALVALILRTFLPELLRVCEGIALVNARLGTTYQQPSHNEIRALLEDVRKSPGDIEKLLTEFLSRARVSEELRRLAFLAPTKITPGGNTFPLLFKAGKPPTILLRPEHLGLLHRIPETGLRMGDLRPYSDIPVAVSVQVSDELVIGPCTSIRELTDRLLAHSIRMVAAQDLEEAGLSQGEAIPFTFHDRPIKFEITEYTNPISHTLCHYPRENDQAIGGPRGRPMKLYACWALLKGSPGLLVRRVFSERKEAEEALSLVKAKRRELGEIHGKLKRGEMVDGYRLEVAQRLEDSQNCLVLRETQVLVFVPPSGACTTVGEWVLRDITQVQLGTDDSSPEIGLLVEEFTRRLMAVVPVVN